MGGECVEVEIGSEATVFFERAAVTDRDGGVSESDQQSSPVRVAVFPAPERGFQPCVVTFEVCGGVGATPDAVGLSVGIQCPVVGTLKTIGVKQDHCHETQERLPCGKL